MRRQYAALLRAISNVSMQPFRDALEDLGFADVDSYGMSGNLLFNARAGSVADLERRINERLGVVTFVRKRSELAGVVSQNPYSDSRGASVLFLKRAPRATQIRKLTQLDFNTDPPVIRRRVVFFRHPTTVRGRRTPVDFEQLLDIEGTARSARVVSAILGRMSGSATHEDG